MDQILEEHKHIIRKYWAFYYDQNKQIEILHSKLEKLIENLTKFQEKQNNEEVNKINFSSYCHNLAKKYTKFAASHNAIVCKINSAKSDLEDAKEEFYSTLEMLDLEIEQRDYEEDLYNLVNGLEDEEYQKF